jgi:hypothetical protein
VYPGSSNELASNLYGNIPNMSLMFTMYAPAFGNYSFQIMPAIPGKTQTQFPTIPYLPLEALLYQNQSSNPLSSPNNTLTGVTAGEQRIGGTSTMNDQFGTARFQQGYSASG